MRVVELQERFGLENVTLATRSEPTAEPGQVVLRMLAASPNYRDLLMVLGQYNPKQPLPLIPGSDGVGQVVSVGQGVERVQVGDRVAPIFAQNWICGRPTIETLRSTLGGPLDGTLTEYLAVEQSGVVHVPQHLSDEEAATLPCAGLTAWNALVTHGGVQPGDTVLVQGTGGVSIFALQFAVLLGARVIVTSSSDEKLERARALGAWETINYRSLPDWGREARRLADDRGVDLVVEVGGAGTLARSLAAVRPGGRISLIGVLAGGMSEINIVPILMGQIRVQGVLVGHRESFEAMNRAIEVHHLRPAVSRVFPLDDTRAALMHLAAGEHFGKIAIRIR
ncbi:MAG: NAD(P)-dependent alcohol dehydrogenase [Gemmatimonadales bacterium]